MGNCSRKTQCRDAKFCVSTRIIAQGIAVLVCYEKLLERNILAGTTPYKQVHARLTPCVINTEEEVMTCLRVLEEIAA